MGMNGYLLAIGPYSGAVKEHLNYPAEWYDSVLDGSTVLSTLFYCDTTSQTRELAESFQNIDLDNPGTWYMENESLDGTAMIIITWKLRLFGIALDRIRTFEVLVANGFDFIFDPGA